MLDNTPIVRRGRKFKQRPAPEPPKLQIGHWYTICPGSDDMRTYGKCIANLPRGRAELVLRNGATLIVPRGTVELAVRNQRKPSVESETPPG